MITILIPTHNRPSYLRRCLSFLIGCGVKHQIFIADSSDEFYFLINKVTVESFSHFRNIRWVNCHGMGILDKCIHSLSKINTPFVLVCGDDDFIFPGAVSKCTNFLWNNDEYSHAHGKIITFFEGKSPSFPIAKIRNYSQVPNESEEISDRVKDHFSRYRNNFYSVHRTKNLLNNLKTANQLDAGRGLKERLIAALDIVDGKRKMFDELFILRQKGITGIDESGCRTFNDNHLDSDYFNQIAFGYSNYINTLRSIFDVHCSSDTSDILTCVDEDYQRWKKERTKSISSPYNEIYVVDIFKRIYRFVRDHIVTLRVKYEIGAMDRKNLKLAYDEVRKYKDKRFFH